MAFGMIRERAVLSLRLLQPPAASNSNYNLLKAVEEKAGKTGHLAQVAGHKYKVRRQILLLKGNFLLEKGEN